MCTLPVVRDLGHGQGWGWGWGWGWDWGQVDASGESQSQGYGWGKATHLARVRVRAGASTPRLASGALARTERPRLVSVWCTCRGDPWTKLPCAAATYGLSYVRPQVRTARLRTYGTAAYVWHGRDGARVNTVLDISVDCSSRSRFSRVFATSAGLVMMQARAGPAAAVAKLVQYTGMSRSARAHSGSKGITHQQHATNEPQIKNLLSTNHSTQV